MLLQVQSNYFKSLSISIFDDHYMYVPSYGMSIINNPIYLMSNLGKCPTSEYFQLMKQTIRIQKTIVQPYNYEYNFHKADSDILALKLNFNTMIKDLNRWKNDKNLCLNCENFLRDFEVHINRQINLIEIQLKLESLPVIIIRLYQGLNDAQEIFLKELKRLSQCIYDVINID